MTVACWVVAAMKECAVVLVASLAVSSCASSEENVSFCYTRRSPRLDRHSQCTYYKGQGSMECEYRGTSFGSSDSGFFDCLAEPLGNGEVEMTCSTGELLVLHTSSGLVEDQDTGNVC